MAESLSNSYVLTLVFYSHANDSTSDLRRNQEEDKLTKVGFGHLMNILKVAPRLEKLEILMPRGPDVGFVMSEVKMAMDLVVAYMSRKPGSKLSQDLVMRVARQEERKWRTGQRSPRIYSWIGWMDAQSGEHDQSWRSLR